MEGPGGVATDDQPEGVVERPQSPRGRTHLALVIVVALVAGAVAGAVTARLTEPDRSTTVTSAGPAATTTTATTSEAARGGVAPADLPAVVEQVAPSVVAVDVTSPGIGAFGRTETQQSSGSGIVISSGGDIATNAHVVSGATSIRVTLADGTELDATLVAADEEADLAVIRVDHTGLGEVDYGDSSSLRVGELVVAMGNALALEGGPTATSGIVSALDRNITLNDGTTYEHLIQTDAGINSGDSGGPLVDSSGRVVGINTAVATSAENIGFAIPIDVAAPVLERLRGG